MPGYVIILDIVGLVLVVIGFQMAFRQAFVRRLLGRPRRPSAAPSGKDGEGDPLAYLLRIAGVMVMAFGVGIALMFTVFNMA